MTHQKTRRLNYLALVVGWALCLFTSVSVHATNYYVSPTGNNSNNGTSTTTPFATLQHAHGRTNPGDTVFIMEGTYSVSSGHVLLITRAGTAENPIVYTKYGETMPKLYAAKNSNCWAIIRCEAGGIVFDGLEIEGDNANITLEEGEAVHDHYVNNPNNRDWNYVASTNTNGFYIIGNRNTHIGPTNVVIKNCYIHDTPGGGISAEVSDYITIENNIVHSTAWYMIWAGSGISFFHPFNSDNNTSDYKNVIRNNICYDNETKVKWADVGRYSDGNGIIVDDTKNEQISQEAYTGKTLVVNNVTYNNGGSGINIYNSEYTDVINNTVYNNSRSPHLNYSNLNVGFCRHTNVHNNIVYAGVTGERALSTSSTTNSIFSNNLYFNGTITTQGANDLVGFDPKFVDKDNGNFQLMANSPAIDRGTANLAPDVDIEGNTRPQRGVHDLGAYEFLGTPEPPEDLPESSSNLVINGEFDTELSNWTHQNDGLGVSTASIVDDADMSGDHAYKAEITTGSAQHWQVQLYQENISLEEGKTYVFSFMAKAAEERTMTAAVQQVGRSWTMYLEETVDLTTEVHTYTYTFTMNTSDTNTKVAYFMGLSTHDVWIDKVSLIELVPPPDLQGLAAHYWNNTELEGLPDLIRVDDDLDMNLPDHPVNGKPAPEINDDNFSVRWKGYIKAEYSELYTFKYDHNDGARVWFNGNQVIDNWVPGRVTDEFTVNLEEGEYYRIVVELFEGVGSVQSILMWSSESQSEEVVPAENFFHRAEDLEPPVIEEPITVDPPVISPESGNYENEVTVTITAEEGVFIHFTTDGTNPTIVSPQYSQPLVLTENTTVKAMAVKEELNSTITTAEFTITKIEVITSLEDLEKIGLNVYPNPFKKGSDVLFVQIQDNLSFSNDLTIVDVTGKEVFRQSEMKRGLNEVKVNLKPGLYILNAGNFKSRLVVE